MTLEWKLKRKGKFGIGHKKKIYKKNFVSSKILRERTNIFLKKELIE
jgi:hypothetical protein